MTSTSTTYARESFAVAGGRGLPVPLQPVTHDPTPRRSYRPPGWDRLPPLEPDAPPAPVHSPRPRPATARRARVATTGRQPTRPTALQLLTAEQARQAVADYEARTIATEGLAKRYGVSTDTVKAVLRAHGVQLRTPGDARPTGTLTADQLTEARDRYADGDSLATIAADLPIGKERLAIILRDAGVTLRGRGGARAGRSAR